MPASNVRVLAIARIVTVTWTVVPSRPTTPNGNASPTSASTSCVAPLIEIGAVSAAGTAATWLASSWSVTTAGSTATDTTS